jgi:pyridoxal phosphate enzyme (YggS family)
MAQLIRGLDARRIADNLARVRGEIGDEIQVLAAVKYVAAEEMGVLAEAGVSVVGENRAQELEVKAQAWAGRAEFTWDFIGHLQSRKVKQVLPHVRWIHSVASDSALEQLGRHGGPQTQVLVEVNVARDESKSGVLPEDLDGFLERCPVEVVGLMTMPPFTERAEDSRRWFAALAELAGERGLRELSMGTSQDYAVAAQEGATIVRLGTSLYT